MRIFFHALIPALLLLSISHRGMGQGCVAVKNMSSCSLNPGSAKGFQLSLNYRYFRSYKHFVGDHEEKHRVEQGTEVINKDHSVNLGLNYHFNSRFSVFLAVPFIYIDRSSMYEHLGNAYPGQSPPNMNNPDYQRFHTQSRGIGDIRIVGYYNLSESHAASQVNVGLGLKLPTGNYRVKDEFHRPQGVMTQVVDQSIQLGDGGTGIITEVGFSQRLSSKFAAYAQGLYMLNPRNTNGVERSANLVTNPTTGEQIPKSNEFSVPDQFLFRAGARYEYHGWQIALGGRVEGIPSKDLLDKSEGFRRPGFIISVEPSVFYTKGRHTFGMQFPVALERNRTRSQIDIARGTSPSTGEPFHGDAAFADWLFSVTYGVRLGK